MRRRSCLDSSNVLWMVQSLLGAIPHWRYQPEQGQCGTSVLDQDLGTIGRRQAQPGPQTSGAGLLGLLRSVLPARLAFLQVSQSGADATAVTGLALISALTASAANQPQARTPRAAAAGLFARAILQAITACRQPHLGRTYIRRAQAQYPRMATIMAKKKERNDGKGLFKRAIDAVSSRD